MSYGGDVHDGGTHDRLDDLDRSLERIREELNGLREIALTQAALQEMSLEYVRSFTHQKDYFAAALAAKREEIRGRN